MKLFKIILILSTMGLIGTGAAYDSEGGLIENETIHTDYDLWMENFKWCTQTNDGTYIYAPELWRGNTPLGLFSWAGWVWTSFLYDNVEIPVTWVLQGKTYDETTNSYVNKGTEYVTGYVMEVSGETTMSNTVKKNVVAEYFTNDSTRAEEFKGTDQDPVHPDYVEVNMSVGAGMEDIEHSEEYGITMTSEEAEAAGNYGEGTDYGFGSGRGGAGGTSEIYNRIVYDDESGSKQLFVVIFYGILPLIFLMYGFKLIGKITMSYGNRRR